MLKLGIDEAGRGPVIGPLVVAGCLIDEKTEKAFKRLGVKDSKQLTEKKRKILSEKIKEKAETFEIIVLPPKIIDGDGFRSNLNEIEAHACAEIINKINNDSFKEIEIIIDCPSPNTEKWRETLKTKIKNHSNLKLICEHKADKNHISVSAASILAKTIREKEMDLLRDKYGDSIGSGYCSDPLTKEFLAKNLKKLTHDGIFRKKWSTWKKASANHEQKKLNDF